jgi:large subunit ribosomal protein L22
MAEEKEIKQEEEKKVEEAKVEEKKEEKSEVKKEEKKIKKEEAHINVINAKLSTKQSMAICKWIRGKDIERSILFLEDVAKQKKVLPMKGEIPHHKGIIGRFPLNASKEFIRILKSLRANAIQNGLEVEKARIVKSIANIGNRPLRRGGRERAKRTHIYIEMRETKKEEKK